MEQFRLNYFPLTYLFFLVTLAIVCFWQDTSLVLFSGFKVNLAFIGLTLLLSWRLPFSPSFLGLLVVLSSLSFSPFFSSYWLPLLITFLLLFIISHSYALVRFWHVLVNGFLLTFMFYSSLNLYFLLSNFSLIFWEASLTGLLSVLLFEILPRPN